MSVFDGIGVVDEADTHVALYLGDHFRRQGAMHIKARLEHVQLCKQFCLALHGILFGARFVYCVAKSTSGQGAIGHEMKIL